MGTEITEAYDWRGLLDAEREQLGKVRKAYIETESEPKGDQRERTGRQIQRESARIAWQSQLRGRSNMPQGNER